MIEVIYKEEKQEAKNGENLFNLPRNIRQVGLTTGNMRIYIEDYVYTFLTRLARNAVGSGKEQGCVAVFTGETKWNNGITYLFIRGALMVEDMEAASDHIDFSEKKMGKKTGRPGKIFSGTGNNRLVFFAPSDVYGNRRIADPNPSSVFWR